MLAAGTPCLSAVTSRGRACGLPLLARAQAAAIWLLCPRIPQALPLTVDPNTLAARESGVKPEEKLGVLLDFNHILCAGGMWADHKKPYLRGVRGKLDFLGNLLPSAGPLRKAFYSLIAHFIFHLSGLHFLPQTLNESPSLEVEQAAQNSCSLRVGSADSSGRPWD